MQATASLFDVETEAGAVVVTPQSRWFGLGGGGAAEAQMLLCRLETRPAPDVVLDLGQTSDWDSSALSFCMRLWKVVRGRGGRVALCNVSDRERQMLEVTKLDRLSSRRWQIVPAISSGHA